MSVARTNEQAEDMPVGSVIYVGESNYDERKFLHKVAPNKWEVFFVTENDPGVSDMDVNGDLNPDHVLVGTTATLADDGDEVVVRSTTTIRARETQPGDILCLMHGGDVGIVVSVTEDHGTAAIRMRNPFGEIEEARVVARHDIVVRRKEPGR